MSGLNEIHADVLGIAAKKLLPDALLEVDQSSRAGQKPRSAQEAPGGKRSAPTKGPRGKPLLTTLMRVADRP
jgi:hypothetical protein